MVGIDDLIESEILTGVAIAAGAIILAPIVVPVLVGVGRPLVKTVIKTGIVLYERGVETAAEVGEAVEDIVAEARAELQASAPKMEGAPEAVATPDEGPVGG